MGFASKAALTDVAGFASLNGLYGSGGMAVMLRPKSLSGRKR